MRSDTLSWMPLKLSSFKHWLKFSEHELESEWVTIWTELTGLVRLDPYQIFFSLKPWRSGRDSGQKSTLLLIPTWQRLWKSSNSRLTNRFDPLLDREMNRRASWKNSSSQGMVRGPWLEKPYSSSAWTRSFWKMGWFR